MKETAPYNPVSTVGMKETAPYNPVSTVGIKETAPYNPVRPPKYTRALNRKLNTRVYAVCHAAHRPVRHSNIFKNKTYKLNISTGYLPLPLIHLTAKIFKERNTA